MNFAFLNNFAFLINFRVSLPFLFRVVCVPIRSVLNFTVFRSFVSLSVSSFRRSRRHGLRSNQGLNVAGSRCFRRNLDEFSCFFLFNKGRNALVSKECQ